MFPFTDAEEPVPETGVSDGPAVPSRRRQGRDVIDRTSLKNTRRSLSSELMRQRKLLFAGWLLMTTACSTAAAVQGPDGPAKATPIHLFEGARLISGDGSTPIEDSAFIVERNRFSRVGKRGDVQAL